MNYLKSAASGILLGARWLLLALSHVLRTAAEGLDCLSMRLDDLRDKVRA